MEQVIGSNVVAQATGTITNVVHSEVVLTAAQIKAPRLPTDLPPFHELNQHLRESAEALMAFNFQPMYNTAPFVRFKEPVEGEEVTPAPKNQLSKLWLDTYSALRTTEGVMSHREFHQCLTCNDFLDRYGSLVFLNDAGETKSVFWDETVVHPKYQDSIRRMREYVEKNVITSMFSHDDEMVKCTLAMTDGRTSINRPIGKEWGGGFGHFYFEVPQLCDSPYASAAQSIENLNMLIRNLRAAPLPALLRAEHLFESHAVLQGQSKFKNNLIEFRELKETFDQNKNERLVRNLLWAQLADPNAAIPRFMSTTTGQLVEELHVGQYTEEQAINAFLKKVDPLNYQRATEAARQGTIDKAEKMFAEKGYTPALERRYATRDELPKWKWKAPEAPVVAAKPTSVFGDLRAREEDKATDASEVVNGGVISWAAFERKVLPNVLAMHVVLSGGGGGVGGYPRQMFGFGNPPRTWPFVTYLTAVHPDAPPILKYDKLEQRNPFVCVMWQESEKIRGTFPHKWGFKDNQEVEIEGIVPFPHEFYDATDAGPGVFVLKGGYAMKDAGLGLFPEILIPELFEVRSVMEAYSNKNKATGWENSFAGMVLTSQPNYEMIVTTKLGRTRYLIDRAE